MSIGLVGAHGTGKTTLAQEYAQQVGIPFVPGCVSAAMKEVGIDSGTAWGTLTLLQRIEAQEHVLDRHIELYKAQGASAFITDRTPIDFMGYMMADVRPSELTPELDERIVGYLARCMEVAGQYFALLICVQPCPEIPYVPREGRGEGLATFREKLNIMMLGYLRSEEMTTRAKFLPRAMHDLNQRVAAIRRVAEQHTTDHIAMLVDAEAHGTSTTVH